MLLDEPQMLEHALRIAKCEAIVARFQ